MNISNTVISRILYVACKIDLNLLFKLGTINSTWLKLMLNESDRYQYLYTITTNVYNLLKYNDRVYDSFVYKRKIIKKYIDDYMCNYISIQSITITTEYLEELSCDQYICKYTHMPIEYYILLEIYQAFPSPFIQLYPANIISDVISDQYQIINNIMNFKYTINDLIVCIPICYSKHFRQRYSESQYIYAMYYVTPINTIVNTTNKFICIQLDISDIESNDEHFTLIKNTLRNQTLNTFEATETVHIIENIVSRCVDLHTALCDLMNNHNFNL